MYMVWNNVFHPWYEQIHAPPSLISCIITFSFTICCTFLKDLAPFILISECIGFFSFLFEFLIINAYLQCKCNTMQYIKLSTYFNHLKLKKKSWTIHSIRLFFPFFFKKRQRIEHMLQKLFMRKISILIPQKTQTVCRTASKMQRKILFNFFKFYSTMKNAIRQF